MQDYNPNLKLNKSSLLLLCDDVKLQLETGTCATLCAGFTNALYILVKFTDTRPSADASDYMYKHIMPLMRPYKPAYKSDYSVWWPLSNTETRLIILAKIRQDIENSDIE